MVKKVNAFIIIDNETQFVGKVPSPRHDRLFWSTAASLGQGRERLAEVTAFLAHTRFCVAGHAGGKGGATPSNKAPKAGTLPAGNHSAMLWVHTIVSTVS